MTRTRSLVASSPFLYHPSNTMWLDIATWLFVALGGVSILLISAIWGRRWCPWGCFSRHPKTYGEEVSTHEYDPLLPQLSPIVYCYSGTSPDLRATLYALSRARTSVEVNDALPGPALEWMFTTLAEAHEFVALCHGHVDFSAIMVSNLASLVVGLQRFAASEPIAQFITDCFRAKVADDLLRLKHEIEKRVPVYDIVYLRLQHKDLQECILTHMELQARVLKASRGFEPPVKLLSEMDDTLFAVNEHSLYPELTVYPGVQQFATEVLGENSFRLREGRMSLDHRDQRPVFLTERTEMWRQRAETELESCGFDHYTLLTGSLNEMLGGAEAAFHHTLQNIYRYKRIFGECELVFVSSNGDRRLSLAQELLHHPQLYNVSAVLLHDILRQHTDNESHIRFFRTYVGAAFQLSQLDLLSLDAAIRVARAASTAFREIPFTHREFQDAAALDLATDLAVLLDHLTPREANALAALMPRAVLHFLVDRLPDDTDLIV